MQVRNTADRSEVEETYRWSIAQVLAGAVEQHLNADKGSPWHNTRFRDLATGTEWIVYLPDQAWPGEVRVVASSLVAT